MTLKKWFLDVWDDILVYAVTLIGVFAAQFLPLLKSGADINVVLTSGKAIIAAVVALYLVLLDEDTKGDQVAKAGKKNNLRRRLSAAMAQGFSWSTLTGMV